MPPSLELKRTKRPKRTTEAKGVWGGEGFFLKQGEEQLSDQKRK